MTKYIRIPKKPDPFKAEIDRRLALKLGAGKREPIPAIPEGPEALFDLSAYLRGNTVGVTMAEVRL